MIRRPGRRGRCPPRRADSLASDRRSFPRHDRGPGRPEHDQRRDEQGRDHADLNPERHPEFEQVERHQPDLNVSHRLVRACRDSSARSMPCTCSPKSPGSEARTAFDIRWPGPGWAEWPRCERGISSQCSGEPHAPPHFSAILPMASGLRPAGGPANWPFPRPQREIISISKEMVFDHPSPAAGRWPRDGLSAGWAEFPRPPGGGPPISPGKTRKNPGNPDFSRWHPACVIRRSSAATGPRERDERRAERIPNCSMGG